MPKKRLFTMDVKRPATPVIGSTLGLIAKRLRQEGDAITRQALPNRWIELLRQLDEEERRISADIAEPNNDPGGCD
jgi:hypothetical protein